MTFDMDAIDQAARRIVERTQSGVLRCGCSMSVIDTPLTEAWEQAEELSATAPLSPSQRREILAGLDPATRANFEATGYEDFDLIYERINQLVSRG